MLEDIAALAKATGLATPDVISSAFDGRNSAVRKLRVAKVLETMVATGAAQTSDDGSRYFMPR